MVELRLLLLFLTIVAFLIFYLGNGLGKKKAYGLLSLYSFFTIFIVSRAYDLTWVNPISNYLHTIQGFLS